MTIYLDMDGVLADFWRGMFEYNGVKSKKYLPEKDASILALKGTDFFNRLHTFESSQTLVNFVKSTGDWGVCSAPLRDDFTNCAYWKRIWLERHYFMPEDATRFIITKKKYKHAINEDGSPNILIDDAVYNIDPWIKKGGIGFLYDASKDDVYELIGKVEKTLLKKVA